MVTTRAILIFAVSILVTTSRFASADSHENNSIDSNYEHGTSLDKILEGIASEAEYQDFVEKNGDEIGDIQDPERSVPACEGIVSTHIVNSAKNVENHTKHSSIAFRLLVSPVLAIRWKCTLCNRRTDTFCG